MQGIVLFEGLHIIPMASLMNRESATFTEEESELDLFRSLLTKFIGSSVTTAPTQVPKLQTRLC